MGFHINDKKNEKAGSKAGKNSFAANGSKFIAKPSSKSNGPAKKPIKTGGSRGS
jgi:hypothetical protein